MTQPSIEHLSEAIQDLTEAERHLEKAGLPLIGRRVQNLREEIEKLLTLHAPTPFSEFGQSLRDL